MLDHEKLAVFDNCFLHIASNSLNFGQLLHENLTKIVGPISTEINSIKLVRFYLALGAFHHKKYRNEKELFNLQCWALTCESFFSKKEWVWLLKSNKYTGDYEFIYFE